MSPIFFELTVITCLAAFYAIVFRLLKQPPILAYILVGILLGPFAILQIGSQETFETLAELGVTLLLFMIGLELRVKDLRAVGKVSLILGVGQILFTSTLGFFICLLLGFSTLTAVYISIALTFSSTIIIVKMLSDKREMNSLYGKISIGFLLVQDMFAIIALILLSGVAAGEGTFSLASFGIVVLKAVILFAVVIYLSRKILPQLIDSISHSSEVLFLFSLAWAFGISALVASPFIGFSIEIGGFLAGLALANSTENLHIAAKVRNLRDFFITIFFVLLGMRMVFDNLDAILFPGIVLSLFVLIGNPLIVMAILGLLGYKKRTAFLSGLTVAQISEFSLIVIYMGNTLGHVNNSVVALVGLVGIITFTASSYMIMYGSKLYSFCHPYLGIFERKHPTEKTGNIEDLQDHVVLIGANRTGQTLIEELSDDSNGFVVIDFDPDVVASLKQQEIRTLFGDVTDSDIQDKAQMDKARLVISTVSDIEDNLLLIKTLDKENKTAKVVVVAHDKKDAKMLYEAGADYVVIPRLTGGKHIAKLIKENKFEHIEHI